MPAVKASKAKVIPPLPQAKAKKRAPCSRRDQLDQMLRLSLLLLRR